MHNIWKNIAQRYLPIFIVTLVPSVALAQSPIDEWKFDETGGSTAHNAIAGRADGELSWGASFAPGVTGNAVSLPAWESVTFGGNTGNLGTSDFTISFWLKTNGNGTPDGRYAEVLGNRGSDGSCDTPYIDIRMGESGNLGLEVNDWGCRGYVPANTDAAAGAVNDGGWHHIIAVRAGTGTKIYIDGVLRASGTAGDGQVANVQSIFPFTAGANDDAFIYDAPFDGFIDDLQIYNRAISPFEWEIALIKSNIAGSNIDPGIANSLNAKLDAALSSYQDTKPAVSINQLQAFIKQCDALGGKKQLTLDQASTLVVLANQAITALL